MTKGYKTTEFWLTLAAMICGLLMSAGIFGDETAASKIVGGVVAILAKLGYTASRTAVKQVEE